MAHVISLTPKMYTVINGKAFEVKQTGNRFFYFSRRNFRWMAIAKAEVKAGWPEGMKWG